MVKQIRIKGDSRLLLSVELRDILGLIIHGDNYYWKVLWLDAIGIPEIFTASKSFKLGTNSKFEAYFSFEELLEFSGSVEQILEIVLVGTSNKDILSQPFKDDFDAKANCEFFIELVDSSYWEVSMHSSEIINLLISNLPGSDLVS